MNIKLTKDQIDLVEKNHQLIYSFMRDYNLSIDTSDTYTGEDWYGICAEALCRAAQTFNPSANYKFSTYAYTCMDNARKHVYRKYGAQSRQGLENVVSLDATCDEDESIMYKDFIMDKTNVEQQVLLKDLENKVFQTLKGRDREIMWLLMQGFSGAEIAKIYHISRNRINDIKLKLQTKLKLKLQ